jgi:amino acid transporter
VTGAFLFIEMSAHALLTVLGFVHVECPVTAVFDPQTLDSATGALAPLGIAGLVLAVTQDIFSYNGYGGAVYFAEETKNVRRSIVRAVLWSVVITIASVLIPLTAGYLRPRTGTHLVLLEASVDDDAIIAAAGK